MTTSHYVVSPGHTTGGVHLHSGDTLTVLGGGTAVATVIDDGGSMTLSSGGVASGTDVSGGGILVVDGSAFRTTIRSGASETVGAGGKDAQGNVFSGGSVTVLAGGQTSFGKIFNGGSEVVSGSAVGLDVSSGGHLIVYGSSTETYVFNGGEETVEAGSTFATHLLSGAQQTVSGGSASSTIIESGGTQQVTGSGTAVRATVSLGGLQVVENGGVTKDTRLTPGSSAFSFAAEEIVERGGTASATVLSLGGLLDVRAGATAIGTRNNWGSVTVEKGGRTTGTINASGTETISGQAIGGSVVSSGTQNVEAGGVAKGTTLSGGGAQNLFSGATASNAIVDAGGLQDVFVGGSATQTTVGSSGNLDTYGSVGGIVILPGGGVLNGGVASDTTIGGVFVNFGKTYFDSVTNGGIDRAFAGASAVSTTVGGNGLFEVYSGVVLSGLTVLPGGNVQFNGSGETSGLGSAVIGGAVHNGGLLTITSGLLTFTGPMDSAKGVVMLGSSGTAQIDGPVGPGQQVAFTGIGERLVLGFEKTFLAGISGFGIRDDVVLNGYAYTSGEIVSAVENVARTHATVTVIDGALHTSLVFDGVFVPSGFSLGSAGPGATSLTYTPPSSPSLLGGHLG